MGSAIDLAPILNAPFGDNNRAAVANGHTPCRTGTSDSVQVVLTWK